LVHLYCTPFLLSAFILQQDKRLWRVRVMCIPPRLSEQPDTVTLEENVFTVI